jgi:hypothetical protein
MEACNELEAFPRGTNDHRNQHPLKRDRACERVHVISIELATFSGIRIDSSGAPWDSIVGVAM